MRCSRGKDDSFILAWMESNLQVYPARAAPLSSLGWDGPSMRMLDSAATLQ